MNTRVVVIHDRNSLQLLAHASGASRVFLILGLIVVFIGFGMFAYAALDFILQGFQSAETRSIEPPDFSKMALWMPLGFGLIVVGGVFWSIGAIIFRRRH